jgi:hypothetical protein
MAFDLSNYMTAEERIELFAADNPNMRMESYPDFQGEFVIVRVALFRTMDDLKPCVMGLAAESLKTQFAIEKAETSAYARAISNLGLPKYSTTKDGAKAPRANRAEMEKVAQFKPQYGAAGSRSAAVEQTLRSSFDADVKAAITPNEPEPVVWSVGDVVDNIAASTPAPQECSHGFMTFKMGISKGGKPYHGYTCSQGCKPLWASLSANGKWYFKGDE